MDKLSAYEILTKSLTALSKRSVINASFENGRFEEYVTTNAITYTLSFTELNGKLIGQIHDNNSQNFQLLEETMKIEDDFS